MFSRFVGVIAAQKAKKRWDPTEEPDELKILQGKADFYTFKTLPWSLWILSSITLSLAIFMHYFLWYVAKKQERGYLFILITIILYYVTFIILYAGKIEFLTVDRTKGTIKYQLINIFLSKIEKTEKIENLTDIEILFRGVIRHSGDFTRYHIRLTFKEKKQLLFGECLTLRKAADKYRKCLAIMKGVIMPDVIDRGMVTDETIDETKTLLKMD